MEHHKTLFEKYQSFFALIICGLLIGGGIVIAKIISNPTPLAGNENQTQESVRADLLQVAKKIGVNKSKFAACLDDGANTAKIASDVELAQNSGVSGTPTFFVLKGGKQFMILGARDLETFETSIASGKAPADQPAMTAGDKIVLSETDHWQGPRDAAIVLVEYSDIDCPYCKAAKPTIDALLKKHPEYAFVYRHSPIASLHPFAIYKAEGSECAAQLGGDEAFWNYLDEVVK